ncbi:uncharacterized protein LOC125675126 [Ostrea edulis]|uniref:uncharacterized protein LOC125675126 n=1 Tax=Ostrea edulis TaxID=37623 RepID=UPI0024AFE5D7|nr:uncharacterized protein LOC125675126 [Ostrea edulis]
MIMQFPEFSSDKDINSIAPHLAPTDDATCQMTIILSHTKKMKQSTVLMEIKEGENFKCEIAFDEIDMIMVHAPEQTVKQHSSQQHFPLVFFDLESRGLARDSHITQLPCVVKKSFPYIPF